MMLMITYLCVLGTLIGQGAPIPMPFPNPQPMAYQGAGCCMPSPTCQNPCQMMMMLMAPPTSTQCCQPSPTCYNPCPSGGSYGIGFQNSPRQPPIYAPLPGEIVFKLMQTWNPELLDTSSPSFQIMEGNVRSAIQAVIGPSAQVTNVYFREGYVPGNPPSRPKTVAHLMINGGSDAASILEENVTPDGSLGDGLKVYKDSFNAY